MNPARLIEVAELLTAYLNDEELPFQPSSFPQAPPREHCFVNHEKVADARQKESELCAETVRKRGREPEYRILDPSDRIPTKLNKRLPVGR